MNVICENAAKCKVIGCGHSKEHLRAGGCMLPCSNPLGVSKSVCVNREAPETVMSFVKSSNPWCVLCLEKDCIVDENSCQMIRVYLKAKGI
jgi:hypothetical protein